MMKLRSAFLTVLAIGTMCSCSMDSGLNRQAAKEYLEPIRPGNEGLNPYWNGFATKFIYAPSFDFSEIDGAVAYLFTVEHWGTEMVLSDRYREDARSEDPTPHWILADGAPTGQKWTFKAASPNADLSEVWNEVPVGRTVVKVEGLDCKGNVIGTGGTRSFLRDFPFLAPYNSNVRPYREAAVMALMFVHEQPYIQAWKTQEEPDMSYRLNTYASKIVSNTIRLEVLLANLLPQKKDEAEMICRNAASFLMASAQSKGHVLAGFPPTYYMNMISSSRPENQGKTMTMEPCYAADAFLDLFDLTADSTYFRQALVIADTYARLQAEDGSLPVKMDYETGEPVNECKAMLTPVMLLFQRIEKHYGVTDYTESLAKAEAWMKRTVLDTFHLTAQFEDMSVVGLKPYQNLTDCASSPYASYLLRKKSATREEIRIARDLVRFSEDQFVCWDGLPGPDGYRFLNTPSVFEQYGYRVPIDNSSACVAESFLDYYEATGDRLWLAKGKALIDNLTVVQNSQDGQIPTSLDMRAASKGKNRGYWTNCTYASVAALLRMEKLTK